MRRLSWSISIPKNTGHQIFAGPGCLHNGPIIAQFSANFFVPHSLAERQKTLFPDRSKSSKTFAFFLLPFSLNVDSRSLVE
jgi:hypothetical protein